MQQMSAARLLAIDVRPRTAMSISDVIPSAIPINPGMNARNGPLPKLNRVKRLASNEHSALELPSRQLTIRLDNQSCHAVSSAGTHAILAQTLRLHYNKTSPIYHR